MKEYIKLFLTPLDANGYEIEDVPFSCRVRSTGLNLVCNELGKFLQNDSNELKIVDSYIVLDGKVLTYTSTQQETIDSGAIKNINNITINPISHTYDRSTSIGTITYGENIGSISSKNLFNTNASRQTGSATISYNKSVKTVTIPPTVVQISNRFLFSAENKKDIVIPATVLSMDNGCLLSSTSLSSYNITLEMLRKNYLNLTKQPETTDLANTVYIPNKIIILNVENNLITDTSFKLTNIFSLGTEKSNYTYNFYTDNELLKNRLLNDIKDTSNSYTITNVYHIDGSAW